MSTNRIKTIYNINSSISGNSTPVSASIIVFFFVFIIGYIYYKIILKNISYDWDNKKCTPKYIFYSGFLNSPTGDPIKDTYNNFSSCIDPTKIPPNGESKFKIVFDTANTITKTANSIINNSNSIMREVDRIKLESQTKVSSVKAKTNIIITTMNQLYNYQYKLYIILKMYFERIFLILDTFSDYTTDIILFKLSNMKYGLNYQGTQLTPFIKNINNEYQNIYVNDINNAVTKFTNIKKGNGTNYQTADYQEVMSACNSATERYKMLKENLINFDKQNNTKLLEIDNLCTDLTNKKIKYTSIFPFLYIKILNPSSFNNQDII